ncbi:hypothetical protein Syun_005938 [Stephania yunnanensis]|uniref:Uncharacterized protein n=1 Tax=Stephania yunnanensis TaxID=152371 RepID=A0AAP0KVQ2_9MAGN
MNMVRSLNLHYLNNSNKLKITFKNSSFEESENGRLYYDKINTKNYYLRKNLSFINET